MNIFYGSSEGRSDVSCESPIEASLDIALSAFRALDPKRGFMGVIIDERFHLQLLPRRGSVRVELLDTSKPAFDASDVGSAEKKRGPEKGVSPAEPNIVG
jgi:hypothetical protein